MNKRTHWLAVYDIRDSKRLRKIEKIMESYGVRIQNSVFEIQCSSKTAEIFFAECNKIVSEEDYILLFSLCEKDIQKRELYGKDIKRNKRIVDTENYAIL